MSYANIARLMNDGAFFMRVNACATEQAMTYKDDGRADIAALAQQVLLGGAGVFMPFIAVQPGFGDVEDQSSISDAQILAAVQAVWPTVAAMTQQVTTP